ncbi:uncharacterized protein LOC135333223 [Halichondria panicea]|uniref:uncharacterized protein LOC135333223 n=1 Tax=Halichondria panicea TaxID=6063 RepID=UPI00312B5017
MNSFNQVSPLVVSTLGLLVLATLPVTVWGQTVSVSNVSVAYQQQAVLGCSLIGYLGAGPVIISIDKVSGPVSTSLFDQQNLTASLTLVAANYSDIGAYRCTAMIDGESVSQTTLYLQINGYQPPTGQFGFGLVKSSETQLVECPVEGVPGPSRFYWQRGQRINALRVTTQTDLLSGPFVDSVGRLDLSKAQNSDSGIYRCTGVDVAGGSGYQLFNIEINNVDEFLLATQWYFILLYALAGVALVAMVILLIWCCYSTRHYWFVKIKTTVVVRKRVKKKTYAEARRKSQETGQRKMALAHELQAKDDYNYDMFTSEQTTR